MSRRITPPTATGQKACSDPIKTGLGIMLNLHRALGAGSCRC
jgi:hypothetical protein